MENQVNPLQAIDVDEKGMGIDGRNRYRACLELGIEPRIRVWKPNGKDVKTYIAEKNLLRRDLTPIKRAELILKLAPELEKEAAERKKAGTKAPPETKGRTSEKLAAVANVSKSTVDRAKKKEKAKENPEAAKPQPTRANTYRKALTTFEKALDVACRGTLKFSAEEETEIRNAHNEIRGCLDDIELGFSTPAAAKKKK